MQRREGAGGSQQPRLLGQAPIWAPAVDNSTNAGKDGALRGPGRPSNLVELQKLPGESPNRNGSCLRELFEVSHQEGYQRRVAVITSVPATSSKFLPPSCHVGGGMSPVQVGLRNVLEEVTVEKSNT